MKFLKREKNAPCFFPSSLPALLPSFLRKALAYFLCSLMLLSPEMPLEEDAVNQSDGV